MSKKFPYKDFAKEAVIESAHLQQKKADEDVLNIIAEHFQKIVNSATVEENTAPTLATDNNAVIIEKFFTPKEEISKEKEQSYQQGYQAGYETAKNEANVLIEAHTLNYEFLQKLEELIKTFAPNTELTFQYIDLIGTIIEVIANKLSLNVPIDFAKMIKEQLQVLIHSTYEMGEITIKTHPNREGFTKEVLQQQSTHYQIDQIKLLSDNKLGENDCILEYKETKLVYSFDTINKEITDIINQFKINDKN